MAGPLAKDPALSIKLEIDAILYMLPFTVPIELADAVRVADKRSWSTKERWPGSAWRVALTNRNLLKYKAQCHRRAKHEQLMEAHKSDTGLGCPPGVIHLPDASDLLPGALAEAPPDATPPLVVPNPPLDAPPLQPSRSSNSAAPSNAGTLERLEDLDALISADRETTGFSALLEYRKALHDCQP
ncbi:hypothetical protein DFH09DRAFT_1314876 [Mycena vulgaris]|nr:hypothetical protein DFH09DRAFT_1314876 [Mycena vulgaris]